MRRLVRPRCCCKPFAAQPPSPRVIDWPSQPSSPPRFGVPQRSWVSGSWVALIDPAPGAFARLVHGGPKVWLLETTAQDSRRRRATAPSAKQSAAARPLGGQPAYSLRQPRKPAGPPTARRPSACAPAGHNDRHAASRRPAPPARSSAGARRRSPSATPAAAAATADAVEGAPRAAHRSMAAASRAARHTGSGLAPLSAAAGAAAACRGRRAAALAAGRGGHLGGPAAAPSAACLASEAVGGGRFGRGCVLVLAITSCPPCNATVRGGAGLPDPGPALPPRRR
jgi:hypothetical protein